MSAAKEVRVLPADVYDTLELSAYAFGGIGGMWPTENGRPHCAVGHAHFTEWGCGEVCNALKTALEYVANVNDSAVARINARKGADPAARVTFREWCDELGVVRGQ
jgi:hypothetical protein